jgi:hypothetical protein
MRTWALALLFAVSWAAQADAVCTATGWRGFWWDEKTEITTTLTLDKRRPCQMPIQPGATGIFHRVYISTPPKHGIAVMRESNSPGYKPNPGFTGTDEFVVTLCGESRTGKGCIPLRVKVIVD